MSQTVNEWTAAARAANAAKVCARTALRLASKAISSSEYKRARRLMLEATLLIAQAESHEKRADDIADASEVNEL